MKRTFFFFFSFFPFLIGAQTLDLLFSFRTPPNYIRDIVIPPNKSIFYCSSGEHIVKSRLNKKKFKRKLEFRAEEPYYKSRFSPDGKYFVYTFKDNCLYLYKRTLTGYRFLQKLEGHDKTQSVISLCFSPDGKRLLSGGPQGELILWEIPSGKQLRKMQVPDRSTVTALALSGNGEKAAIGTMNSDCYIWTLSADTFSHSVHTGDFSPGSTLQVPSQLAFTEKDSAVMMIVYGGSKTLLHWNPANGKLSAMKTGGFIPNCFTFARQGRYLVAGTQKGELLFIDPRTGTLLKHLSIASVPVTSLALTPDSGILVSGDEEGYVSVWNSQSLFLQLGAE
ncbi:MAG: hypothetical protein AB1458_03265 [Bacteroidota bacterium]